MTELSCRFLELVVNAPRNIYMPALIFKPWYHLARYMSSKVMYDRLQDTILRQFLDLWSSINSDHFSWIPKILVITTLHYI